MQASEFAENFKGEKELQAVQLKVFLFEFDFAFEQLLDFIVMVKPGHAENVATAVPTLLKYALLFESLETIVDATLFGVY